MLRDALSPQGARGWEDRAPDAELGVCGICVEMGGEGSLEKKIRIGLYSVWFVIGLFPSKTTVLSYQPVLCF